jgi:catechol 2,3-dioxygenase-like lactoylglutathione lyase family enzyme
MSESTALEMRVALTVSDFEKFVALYRDGLNLPVAEQWASPAGRGIILKIENATLELLDETMVKTVDEVEAGQRISGTVRLGFQVPDVEKAGESLVAHGAKKVHDSVMTPWGDFNQRLQAPDGMQITLFQRPPEQ